MALHKWCVVIGIVFLCSVRGQAQKELPSSIQALSSGMIAMAFEKEIRLYNEDLQLLDTFVIIPAEETISIRKMEWSPDSQYVAISTYPDSKLQLWQYSQKIKVFESDYSYITGIVWAYDSQTITIFHKRRVGSTIFTYSLDGTTQREWLTRLVLGGTDWSSSHNLLAVPGKNVKILDATSFQYQQILPTSAIDPGIRFNDLGNKIAFIPLDTDHIYDVLQVWSYKDGEFSLSRKLIGHTKSIRDFEWWGDLIATYSGDDTIRIWNASDGNLLSNLSAPHVDRIEWSPKGNLITRTDTDDVIRDEITGEILASLSTANQTLTPTSAP